MTRLEYNLMILDKLEAFCHKYPDMRFMQALATLLSLEHGEFDFYMESQKTHERIEALSEVLFINENEEDYESK